MKRSDINSLIRSAKTCFELHGWTLPPQPRWDVTDFGLGDWRRFGLVLVNLAEEPEYCEKLMYAQKGMVTPAHAHHIKKEDIICRWGTLQIQLWAGAPAVTVKINGEPTSITSGGFVQLSAGERITLLPGIVHEFVALSEEAIIGEVSTANDDARDNIFVDPAVGRYSEIEEDVSPITPLRNELNR